MSDSASIAPLGESRFGRLDGVTLALGLALTSCLLVPSHVAGMPLKSLLTVAFALLALSASTLRPSTPLARSDGAFLILLLAAVASILAAGSTDSARLALAVPLAMYAAHRAASRLATHSNFLLDLYVALSAIVAAFGTVGHFELRALGPAATSDPLARAAHLATPFFDHAYLAVQASAPAAAIALFSSRRATTLRRRFALALAALVILSFVVLSLSRAAMLSVALGVAVAGILELRARTVVARGSHELRTKWRAVLVVAALIAAVAIGNLVLSRFRELIDPSLAVTNFMRVLIWQDTLALISDHLPFGVGIGNFGFEFGRYHAAARPMAHAHDQWLHSLAETGAAGLVGAILVFLVPWLHHSRRERAARRMGLDATGGWREDRDPGLIAALVATFCIAWFESPLAFMGSAVPFAIGTAHMLRSVPDSNRLAVAQHPRIATVTNLAVLLVAALAAPAWVRVSHAGHLGHEAQTALVAGDIERCRSLVTRARSLTDALPELDTLEARAALASGDYEWAAAALESHEKRVPFLADHLIDLATVRRELGTPERAIEPLSLAIPRAMPESIPGIRIERLNMLAKSRAYEETRLEAIELIARGVHLVEPLVLLRLAEALTNLRRDRGLAVAILDEYAAAIAPVRSQYVSELKAKLYENP